MQQSHGRTKEYFSNLDENYKDSVKLSNYFSMVVTGKVDVRIHINVNTYNVTNVFFVPNLRKNLLGIGQLQEKCLSILFQHGKCKVFFHHDNGLIMGNPNIFHLYVSITCHISPFNNCPIKNLTFSIFKTFKIHIEKEDDSLIICLRTDCREEFTSLAFTNLFFDIGIRTQLTTTYTLHNKMRLQNARTRPL